MSLPRWRQWWWWRWCNFTLSEATQKYNCLFVQLVVFRPSAACLLKSCSEGWSGKVAMDPSQAEDSISIGGGAASKSIDMETLSTHWHFYYIFLNKVRWNQISVELRCTIGDTFFSGRWCILFHISPCRFASIDTTSSPFFILLWQDEQKHTKTQNIVLQNLSFRSTFWGWC